MTNRTAQDAIDAKLQDIRDWLYRTGKRSSISGDGVWIAVPIAAQYIGISSSALRALHESSPKEFRFLRGAERGRWQIRLRFVAAYLAEAEHVAETR